MRGCEIRDLRWSDVDLLADTLTIRKSKTAAGVRTIPLTRTAFETFAELHKRAELFGDVLGEYYVFARFKPVGRFEGKELQECVWLDLIQRGKGVAHTHNKGGLARITLSRSTASSDYGVVREWRERANDQIDSGPCLTENAGTATVTSG
jgi:integrase